MGNSNSSGKVEKAAAELRRLEATISPAELKLAKDTYASVISSVNSTGTTRTDIFLQFRLDGFDIDPSVLAGVATQGAANAQTKLTVTVLTQLIPGVCVYLSG